AAAGHVPGISQEQQQVAGLSLHRFDDASEFLSREILAGRAPQRAIGFNAEPSESAGAVVAFDELRQLVEPPPRELFGPAVDFDAADKTAIIGRAAKHAERN